MRVLFFSFPYESAPGGGERYTEQTVEGLLASRRAVTLVSSSRALVGLFLTRGWSVVPLWGGIEPVTAATVALFALTSAAFVLLLGGVLCWYRFARDARMLVCLSLADKLSATLPARMLGMRVIWMEHLVAGRSLVRNPYRRLYAALARLATLVTVSDAAADSLAAVGVPRAHIRVIAPGITERPVVVRPSGAPTVGAISRLSREKNVGLLLQAFALVAREIPEARLAVYGDGPERDDLARAAETLGIGAKTTFFGHVPAAGARCGDFDVLAVPSSRESFGLAALEAMACGVPVVATRVGGLPELILDGETGMLVPPEDARRMADALIKLLRDPGLRTRLGETGRARAAARFSERKMQAAWIELSSAH